MPIIQGCLLLGLGWMLVLWDLSMAVASQGPSPGFWVVMLSLTADPHRREGEGLPGFPSEILYGCRGEIPEIIALGGLRDRGELEAVVAGLNRRLGPDERTFVSWPSTGYQGEEKKGLALLSRFPLARLRDFSPSGSSTNLLYALLDAWGKPFHVFVLRLEPEDGSGPDGSVRDVAKVCRNFADSLLRARPQAALLILGDFGIPISSPLLRRIQGLQGEESSRLFPLGKERGWQASQGTAHMLVSKALYGDERIRAAGRFGGKVCGGGQHTAVWGWVFWSKERRGQ